MYAIEGGGAGRSKHTERNEEKRGDIASDLPAKQGIKRICSHGATGCYVVLG